MKSLRGHPNIVSLEDVLHTDESLTLVFELCKQDLKAFIDSFKPPGSTTRNTSVPINMPADIIRDLTYQMLRGVGALHENRIIHRDLKVRTCTLPYPFMLARLSGFLGVICREASWLHFTLSHSFAARLT